MSKAVLEDFETNISSTPLEHKPTRELRPTQMPVFSYEQVLLLRGSVPLIVGSVSFATFADIFIYSIIVPVVPYVLESRLGIAESSVQHSTSKILALYSVGLIVGSVVFGYVADRLKHRRLIMLLGLLILVGATLILFFARSMALYMVGRVIQGLSAATVWVVGLAIVADVGDSSNMAFLMSFPGMGLSFGMFLGPLVGGVVYERAGYNSVFYVCFGVLAVDILLRIIMLERSHMLELCAERAEKLAAASQGLSAAQEEFVRVYYRNRPPQPSPEASPEGEPAAPFTVTLFKRTIRIPTYLGLLGDVRILNAFYLSIVLAWIMTAFESILTLHVEEVFGFSALQSGLLFIAFAGPSLFEPVVGRLSDRLGPRRIVFCGFMLATPALILMRLADHEKSAGRVACLSVLLVAAGLCVSTIFAPVTSEFSNAVAEMDERRPGLLGAGRGFGQAYGLFNVAYALGSLIGPFEAGGIAESHGWGAAVLSLGIVTFVSGLVTYPFTGGVLKRGEVFRW